MTPLRRWDRGSRLALAGVVASGALAILFAAGALRPVRFPGPLPPAPHLLTTSPDVAVPGASDRAVLATVARAPFRPDRHPPAVAYELPSQRRPAVAATPPSPFLRSRLVGTVLRLSGGMAMLDVPGRGSRVMAVGDSLDGFRLVRVGRGTAAFAGPDSLVTFHVPGLR